MNDEIMDEIHNWIDLWDDKTTRQALRLLLKELEKVEKIDKRVLSLQQTRAELGL